MGTATPKHATMYSNDVWSNRALRLQRIRHHRTASRYYHRSRGNHRPQSNVQWPAFGDRNHNTTRVRSRGGLHSSGCTAAQGWGERVAHMSASAGNKYKLDAPSYRQYDVGIRCFGAHSSGTSAKNCTQKTTEFLSEPSCVVTIERVTASKQEVQDISQQLNTAKPWLTLTSKSYNPSGPECDAPDADDYSTGCVHSLNSLAVFTQVNTSLVNTVSNYTQSYCQFTKHSAHLKNHPTFNLAKRKIQLLVANTKGTQRCFVL